MIGVHILPDQGDLANAGFGQPLHFGGDFFNRPRDFGAARIRHNAEGAELVAAFLHRDECGNAAPGDHVFTGRRQRIKLVLDGKFGVDDFLTALRAGNHLRQPVIILRADYQIDGSGATDDFLAFRLCHAAGDRDQHLAAIARGGVFQFADTADFRIDFIGRLFADVAGIENDEVGVFGARGFAEPGRHQRVRHTMGIVDVHLAAERFDVDFAGSAHAVSVRSRTNLACRGGICPAEPYI